MSEVIGLCPACCYALRIEEELTICTSAESCYECGRPIVRVPRHPGVSWPIGSALWSSTVIRARALRDAWISERSKVPPPPQDQPMPVGEKEPGWGEP